MSALSPSATEPAVQGSRGYQYRWMVMAVVIIADVKHLLAATIANLAGPSIRAAPGCGASTLQRVLASYTIAFAIGLAASARAGHLARRRPKLITGIARLT